MRIAWLTDIHLNFLNDSQQSEFIGNVRDAAADVLLIGGDIGEAHSVIDLLKQIDDALQRPIYFVLGNHDFYYGSIGDVRRRVVALCQERPRLHYLSESGCHSLTQRTAIVGHDGWADAREGNYARSLVTMNDYRLIAELAPLNKEQRWNMLKLLGDEAAAHIKAHLPSALERHEHVLLLTHVPPLRGACWYDGQISDDEWAPHFTCQSMGCAMLEVMENYPQRQLTVFCGHTHGSGTAEPLPNVIVHTGGAEYGHPTVAKVFQVD